ncbi:sulfotransferase [Luteolibacter sp. GHJ8]|uniref:Sulfotransferase n=1 Tax=Luteolibacter rhizosphaerae TaxID=2989719 RepID=A0ABT3G7H6_9BACT|nr:sulfotransferase [Luteolibacter rhizosphaerae]MCW1915808.1 sulfotransferase [Luteolibacter rhizosphaerae]
MSCPVADFNPQGTPDEEVAVLTQAFHARRRGDYAGALELFMRAVDFDPGSPYPWIEMARVDALALDFEGMSSHQARALILAEGDADALYDIACVWMDGLMPEECLKVAAEGERVYPRDDRFLGRHLAALERLNRVEEALELVSGRRIPRGSAKVVARLLRRSGKPDEALSVLSGLEDAEAHMERAACLDRAGKYRLAMEALDKAKAILAADPETDYERKLYSHHATRLMAVRERIGSSASNGNPDTRLAFVLGHPRSGTTLLETMLAKAGAAIASEYPLLENCIRMTARLSGGEADADGLGLLEDADRLPGVRESYLARIHVLAQAGPADLVVDKNPGLTDGVHWIARCFPEARIVTLLRDPRDVIVSCMFQSFGHSRLGVACLTWESAARAYADTMMHWAGMRGLLGTGTWMELRYEDLVRQPEDEFRKVSGFLRIAAEGAPSSLAEMIRTPSYGQVLAPVHAASIGRWKNYRRRIDPLRKTLEPVMQALGYRW